jgi:hypothetical protein
MVESVHMPDQRRQLLLDDGHRSLVALERSLSRLPGSAGAEASLHVMDLSSLCSGLGLKKQALFLKELAQGLSEDSPATLSQAQSLLPTLKHLLEALQTGDEAAIESTRLALDRCFQKAPSAAPQSEVTPSPTPVQNTVSEPVAPTTGSVAPTELDRWSDAAPLFPAVLTASSFSNPVAAEQTPVAEKPSVPYPSVLADVRAQAVQMVQDAGACLNAQQSSVADMLIKLNAVQDALVRVGQMPIKQVYPDTAAADLCADPEVLELLEHLQIFSQRAARISVQMRNLMLFVLWQGATLSQAELAHVGQKVATHHGRVDFLDTGVQLVLPVSALRMPMVSFQVGGQWFATSLAQFQEWGQDRETVQLKLRCGVQDRTVPVEQSGTSCSMNVYPWPDLVPAPEGIRAVALDGLGRVHLVRRDAA